MGCESSTPATAGVPADEKYEDAKSSTSSARTGLSEEDTKRIAEYEEKQNAVQSVTLDEIKQRAEAVFHRVDVDGSKELDKEEFLGIASSNSSKNKKKQESIERKQDEAATELMRV